MSARSVSTRSHAAADLAAVYDGIQAREAEFEKLSQLLRQANASIESHQLKISETQTAIDNLRQQRSALIQAKHRLLLASRLKPTTCPPFSSNLEQQDAANPLGAVHQQCDGAQDMLRAALGQVSQHASRMGGRLMAAQSRCHQLEATRRSLAAQVAQQRQLVTKVQGMEQVVEQLKEEINALMALV